MPEIDFRLDVAGRIRMYEDEIKRADHTIITSNDLTEIYNAHQRKQEYERLLNQSKGA